MIDVKRLLNNKKAVVGNVVSPKAPVIKMASPSSYDEMTLIKMELIGIGNGLAKLKANLIVRRRELAVLMAKSERLKKDLDAFGVKLAMAIKMAT